MNAPRAPSSEIAAVTKPGHFCKCNGCGVSQCFRSRCKQLDNRPERRAIAKRHKGIKGGPGLFMRNFTKNRA